jgi:hypothetical protein
MTKMATNSGMGPAAYSFSARNPVYSNAHDILFTDGFSPGSTEYRRMYERAHRGDDAKRWRFQYLAIEEELERAMRYVDPCDENAGVFSIKFAEIIRGAANAYEIMAKELDAKFYSGKRHINIYDYLALDIHLNLVVQTVTHFAAQGTFPLHPEVCKPFDRLATWDKVSVPDQNHVPSWWTGYNKVKHTNQGLKGHATLANAMAGTAAVFLLIERVYGFGVLQGGLYNMPSSGGNTNQMRNHPQWARLFLRI